LVLEQGLVILFVYMPYVVGELCHLSGIVTTLTAGMASRKFIYPNLNPPSQVKGAAP
jgi:NhaP-type Na+/H+ or K+/H+ antiporter